VVVRSPSGICDVAPHSEQVSDRRGATAAVSAASRSPHASQNGCPIGARRLHRGHETHPAVLGLSAIATLTRHSIPAPREGDRGDGSNDACEMDEREVALLILAVGEGKMPVEQALPLVCPSCSGAAVPITGARFMDWDYEEIDGEDTMIVREEITLWGECPTCGKTAERNWGPVYEKLGVEQRFAFSERIEEAAQMRRRLVRPAATPVHLLHVPTDSQDTLVTPSDQPVCIPKHKWRSPRLFRAWRNDRPER